MTDLQLGTRRQAYLFNGLKSFLEQIGTVLIIILTAYLVLIVYPGMTIGKIMYHVMLFANVSAPIRQLHRIYVLQQGRVVQQGTPDDVYRQGGLYKEIFDASARSMNADKIAATTDF